MNNLKDINFVMYKKNEKILVDKQIEIAGKGGNLLKKYEFEVYYCETRNEQWYDIFYHRQHICMRLEVKKGFMPTFIELKNAFIERLNILKDHNKREEVFNKPWRDDENLKISEEEFDHYQSIIESILKELENTKYFNEKTKIKIKNIIIKKTINKIFSIIRNIKLEIDCKIIEIKINKRVKQIDWNNVVKGILWDGVTTYQLSLNDDGTIYCDSIEEKRDMPKQYVLEGMDIYDKDGKCVSKWEDF